MKYLNLSPEVIRRPGTGMDCVPQVLLNYHPVSRECWCLKPFIDTHGRTFQSNFLSVRATEERFPHAFVWAILASPLANLFVYTHTLKRNIVPRILGRLPIPAATEAEVARVVSCAELYLSCAKKGRRDMFTPDGYTEKELLLLLYALDAEMLRLYSLPSRAERLLLEQFRGEQRPGVPFQFTEYFPLETPEIPFYAYRADSYQRWLNGDSPELSEKEFVRYESLVEKAERGKLTRLESDRLHKLQAEVDGRDYAIQQPPSLPITEATKPEEFEQRLRALSDRVASSTLERERS